MPRYVNPTYNIAIMIFPIIAESPAFVKSNPILKARFCDTTSKRRAHKITTTNFPTEIFLYVLIDIPPKSYIGCNKVNGIDCEE